jgi:RNase H-fold protein (predicted Holliday junction resolvase)
MTPEELFHASGHSQESVDQFFAELRELTDIPARIVEERKSKAIALLKVAQ